MGIKPYCLSNNKAVFTLNDDTHTHPWNNNNLGTGSKEISGWISSLLFVLKFGVSFFHLFYKEYVICFGFQHKMNDIFVANVWKMRIQSNNIAGVGQIEAAFLVALIKKLNRAENSNRVAASCT